MFVNLFSSKIGKLFNVSGFAVCFMMILFFAPALETSAAPNACVQPSSGLVSWWRAEGNANDFRGLNNGTLQNGATFTTGKVGQAFSFDGGDDSIKIPYMPTLAASAFSVEAWVKPLAPINDPTNQEVILAQSGGRPQLNVRPGVSGLQVVFQYQDTISNFPGAISTSEIPIGSFSHLAGTFSGTTLRLYINGTLNAQFTPSLPPVASTCRFSIGGFGGETASGTCAADSTLQFSNSVIDEASYYTRTLTATEIQAIYNADSVGKCVSAPNNEFDFDGDNKTDISIFRPAPGEWWYQKSSNGGNSAFTFGTSSDKIVPADYTGDGKTDVAFFRPSSGQWFVLRSEDNSFFAFPFGTSTDTPVPADYDGDGKADAAVFRPSTLTWFINKSSGGTDIIGFGAAGDKPVVSDYDGDGKADIAIYRANGGVSEWWIRRSSTGTVFAAQFGAATDKAVQGDYTGDGKADIAVWRPANGNWFVLRSEDFSFFAFPFGTNGDVPVAGDYDGDGKTDAGVFRPTNSTWFVQRSTAGTLIQQFGIAGDQALPNAFVP